MFYDKFPMIAMQETRCLTVFNQEETGLPPDTYNLIELYCDDPGCDCRRVMLTITSEATKKNLATIAYGWESRKFYAKWLGMDFPEMLDELKGPALNTGSFQSELAPALLESVKIILKDQIYVERLKSHYLLFREEVDRDQLEHDHSSKVRRNDPCPCGSKKKYKHCCL